MSVQITKGRTWQANKWVSLKLFKDCTRFTSDSSDLERDIVFLNKVSIDLLDLTEFGDESIREFHKLLDMVIAYNLQTKGNDMDDSSYFETYQTKLLELKEMLNATLK